MAGLLSVSRPTAKGPRRLIVGQADVDSMFAHSIRETPNEACGVLVGVGESVESVAMVANVDASPYTYSIDSRELNRAFTEAMDAGLDVIGNFHSHTRTDAYPSPTDVKTATFLSEWIHCLVSLKYDMPAMRAYRIIEGEIFEIPVLVDG